MTTVVVHAGSGESLSMRAVAMSGAELHVVVNGSGSSHSGMRVQGPRDPDFLDALMRWLDGVIAESGDARPELEIARYRLLFDLADIEHPAWVLAQLAADVAPGHVVWSDERMSPLRRAAVAAHASARGMSLEFSATPSWPSMSGLKSGATELAYPYFDRLRRAVRAAKTRAAPRSDVVFFEFFPNSAKVLVPVARELEERGVGVTWLAGRPEVARILQGEGIASVTMEDAIGGLDFVTAAMPEPIRLAKLEEAIARGTAASGRPTLAHRTLLAAAAAPALLEAQVWLRTARKAIAALRPRVLASTSYSSVPGRAFATAAREAGARTVFVEHGSYPDRFVWSHFLHDEKVMWGEHARASLLKHGHRPGSVHALGAPLYDAFAARASSTPWSAPEPQAAWRVLFLASRSGGMVVSEAAARQTFRTLARIVADTPGLTLTVKAHPSDATCIPEDELNGRARIRLVRQGSSQDLILESDLVVVASSTTGFEACIARRPLIEVRLAGEGSEAGYATEGAALLAVSEEDLRAMLSKLREDATARDAIARAQGAMVDQHLGGADGRASARIAELLRSYLQ